MVRRQTRCRCRYLPQDPVPATPILLGLTANLVFYNKLKIADLDKPMGKGLASALTALGLRASTASIDLPRILAAAKANAVESTIRQLIALVDYVQSLCGYLAVNETLEPADAAICELLRIGADFERAVTHNPSHLTARAIRHICSAMVENTIMSTKTTPPPKHRREDPETRLGTVTVFRGKLAVRSPPATTATSEPATILLVTVDPAVRPS